jgi:hypothetical protein
MLLFQLFRILLLNLLQCGLVYVDNGTHKFDDENNAVKWQIFEVEGHEHENKPTIFLDSVRKKRQAKYFSGPSKK